MIRYKIGKLLKEKGMSARKLASKAGIGVNTAALLAQAESLEDYNTTLEVIDRICLALEVRMEEILKFQKN